MCLEDGTHLRFQGFVNGLCNWSCFTWLVQCCFLTVVECCAHHLVGCGNMGHAVKMGVGMAEVPLAVQLPWLPPAPAVSLASYRHSAGCSRCPEHRIPLGLAHLAGGCCHEGIKNEAVGEHCLSKTSACL